MAENSNDKELVKTKYNIPKVGINKFYDQPLTIKETKYDGNLQADAIRDVGGLEPILAANQTGWDEAVNGITRGVVSGLATAVEDFAYIPNIFTQDFEANALAQAMKDVKEDLREALPIYRSGDNPFSWDSEMFWESTAGVLDSGIGFAIPGIGIAKGVGLAGKAISKAGRLGKLGARTAALRQSALGNPLLKKLSTSTIAGAISNDLEGTMMGVEIYENKVKELIDKRNNGELQATDEQIKNVAHSHAANFKLHNRAFAITDAFALQGLTRGHGITRNLIANPKNFKNKLTKALTSPDSLLAQGVTEGAEEIAQGVMQKMAEFNIDEQLGLVKDDKGAFKRAIEYALDRETLYEGMLGFFGGGFQRVLSSSSNKAADFLHDKKIQKKIKNLQGLASVEQDPDKKEIYESRIKDLERERASFKRENEYNRQQRVIDGIEEELASVVGKEVNLSEVEAYFDGDSPGDKQMQQLIRDVKFRNIALRHFENGTTEKLEESLANIEDTEERSYYQSKLKTYEKFYINHSGSSVNDLLFSAYSDIEMLQDKVKAIDTMIEQVKADENIVDEDLVKQFEEKKSVFQEQLEKAREDYKKIKANDKEVLADILNKKVKEFLDAENEKQVDELKEDHKRDGFDTSEAAEEAKTNVRDKQDREYSRDSQPPPADQFEPGFEDDITSEPPQPAMTDAEAEQAAQAQMDLDRQRAEGPPQEAPSEEEILSQPLLDPKASANEPPVATPSGAEPNFDSETAKKAKAEEVSKETTEEVEPTKSKVTEEKLSDNEKQAFEDTELGQESTTNEDDAYVETEEASNVQDKGTKLFDQRDLPPNVNPEDSVFKRFFDWLRTWSQQKDAKLSDFRIKFELSFDENLYSAKNKELAKSLALLAKQSQTLNTENLKKLVDNVTIKAIVVRADGTSVVEGEEVFTTLRLPSSERPETLYPFREDIIKRLLSGQDAITEIQGQYAMGFDNQPTQDGLAPENSLEIFYDGDINEIEENLRIGNSGRNNDGTFTTSSETRWLTLDSNDDIDLNARSDSSIAGKVGMKVRNPNGSYSVAKLNVKKIDDAAADLIFDAYKSAHAKFKKDGVKGLGYPPPNDLVNRLQDIVGFEYKPKTMLELIQFFVHDGSFRTKEGKRMYNTETKIVLREGALSFGEQELTDFDNPAQVEEFKNFLKEKKRFNIRRGKIFPNKQMRTNYIQWLVDNKILNTDLSPQIFAPQQNFSGSIFAKPFRQEKVAPISKPTAAQTEVVKKLDNVVEPSKEQSEKYLDSKDFFGKQDTSNSEDFTEDQISKRLKYVIADFFNGKLKRQYSDQTDTPYFESESVFNAFIDRLEAIKQQLHAEGSIIYPKPVTLTDESAGLLAQPEILIVKSDGTVSILSFDVFKARPDKMRETANGRKRLQRRKDELNLQRIIGLNIGLNMGSSKVHIFRIGYGLQKFSVSSVEQTDSQLFESKSQVTNNEKRTYAVKVETPSESTASKNQKLSEKPAGEKLISKAIDKVNRDENPQDAKAFEKGLRKDWETYSESEEEYLRSFDIGIIGFYQYLVENFGFSEKATPRVDVENNQIVIGEFVIEGTDLESIDMAQVLIDKNAGLVKRSIRKRERLSQEAKSAPKSVPPAAPSAAPPTVSEPPMSETAQKAKIKGEIKEESKEYKEAVEKLEEERKQALLDHEEKWNRKAMSAAEDGENIYRPESPEEQDEWQQYGHPEERERNEIEERFEKEREKLDKSFKNRNQKNAQSDKKAKIAALKNRNRSLSARTDDSTKDNNLTDPDNNQKCE